MTYNIFHFIAHTNTQPFTHYILYCDGDFCTQTAVIEGSTDDSKLQAKVFRCLGSWFNVCTIPQDVMVNSPLLMAPFQALVKCC